MERIAHPRRERGEIHRAGGSGIAAGRGVKLTPAGGAGAQGVQVHLVMVRRCRRLLCRTLQRFGLAVCLQDRRYRIRSMLDDV